MKRTMSALETITGSLAQLERPELEELAQIVAALLDLQAPEEAEVEPGQGKQAGSKAKGHIEEKLINGYGPYRYLRYWQGKTLKSQYIGKAKDVQAN